MKRFLLGTAVGLATLAAASVAQALPTYNGGSFAFTSFTTTTTDVTTTTTFTLSPASITPGAPVGDFTAVVLPASLAITSPLIFATPSAATFDFTDAGLGTFTAATVTLLGTHPGLSASASYNVVGTFTLGADWANAGTVLTANETWALSQTGGPGNAISLSGTFHSPAAPVQKAPEPLTIALVGAGLAGLGMRRRNVH